MSDDNREQNTIPRTPKKSREPIDPGTAVKMKRWVDHSGVDFLNSSMDRLQISLDDIKNLKYKQYSFDYLLSQKKMVKEELKLYDTMFYNNFRKLPTRAEKEPLRPLYMYYKKLKQGIDNLKNKRKSSVNNSVKEEEFKKAAFAVNIQQRRSYDANNPEALRSSAGISEADDEVISQNVVSKHNESATLSNNSSQNNFRKLAKKHLKGYSQNSHRDTVKVVKPLGEVNGRSKTGAMNSARQKVNSLQAEINKENYDVRQAKNTQQPESVSRAELDKQIKEYVRQREKMIKERKKLRLVLDKFQNQFLVQHGRKIKYMHDVKEVAYEYSKYKSLKGDIAKVEAKLKSMLSM
jgi:hypothetical protein